MTDKVVDNAESGSFSFTFLGVNIKLRISPLSDAI